MARDTPHTQHMVLHEPKSWRKSRGSGRRPELTAEETTHVRAAIVFLRQRRGGWRQLAEAMGVNEKTLSNTATVGKTISAAMAIRAARVAEVSTDDVLEGRFPLPGACPVCGRAGIP